MWWGDGGAYIVSSYAREESPVQHDGQVWFYDPKRRTLTLKVLLGVNPDPSKDGAFDGPDNITVSPYGGLVIAEDGEGIQHLFGATDERPYVPDRPQRPEQRHRGGARSTASSPASSSRPTARRCTPTSRPRASCSPSPGPWKRQPEPALTHGPERARRKPLAARGAAS